MGLFLLLSLHQKPVYLHPHHQGQLYCVGQVRCGVHYPECYSWYRLGPALQISCSLGQFSHLPQVGRGEVGGYLSLTLITSWKTRWGRVSSSAFMPLGPAYPCSCQQHQLYCAAQVRWRANSPTLMTLGPALLPATGGGEQGGKGSSTPSPALQHDRQVVGPALLHSHP